MKNNKKKKKKSKLLILQGNISQSVFFFRATSNKKLKETVALELSYVNSNLQLLKEELADLNSSVQIYQNDG